MRRVALALLLVGCGTKTVANKSDRQLDERKTWTETATAAKTETAEAAKKTDRKRQRIRRITKPDGTVIDELLLDQVAALATFRYGGASSASASTTGRSDRHERDRSATTTTTRSRWWWPLDNAWWLVPVLVVGFVLVRRFVWRGVALVRAASYRGDRMPDGDTRGTAAEGRRARRRGHAPARSGPEGRGAREVRAGRTADGGCSSAVDGREGCA